LLVCERFAVKKHEIQAYKAFAKVFKTNLTLCYNKDLEYALAEHFGFHPNRAIHNIPFVALF
jgi:hypothetical protein